MGVGGKGYARRGSALLGHGGGGEQKKGYAGTKTRRRRKVCFPKRKEIEAIGNQLVRGE